MNRHSRQVRLAEVGPRGQSRLAAASVDIGVEGLSGEVAARYLAGAGVGRLRLRSAALASAALAVDSTVRTEVDPDLALDVQEGAFDLRDPVARDLARGARAAL